MVIIVIKIIIEIWKLINNYITQNNVDNKAS